MFEALKKKWYYLTHLGVNAQMTISLQKKVILSNYLAFVLFILLNAMNLVSLFLEPFSYVILLSSLSILTILTVPLMNSMGNYHTPAFLISVLTPFFLNLFSTVVTTELVPINSYYVNRYFLIAMLIIPFIVIDKSRPLSLIVAILFILLLIFSTDFIFELKGYAFDPKRIDLSKYHYLNYYLIFCVFIVLFGLSFLTNINVRYEDRILQLLGELTDKNEELRQQQQIISNAFQTIEQKNTKITQSIEYAQRIQSAFLPGNDFVKDVLPESFVLYLPRDIVSGDFYWINEVKGKKVIIAADCTGHGVPGAFLSILGVTLLNEIILNQEILEPAKVLNILRDNVKKALQQSGSLYEQKDGMDIALCVVDTHTLLMDYAGAYHTVYILRNNELICLKGDKQPIGSYLAEKEFSSAQFQLQAGDMVYLFSDGYLSQFGGPKSHKMSTNRFKELILSLSGVELNMQQEVLSNFLTQWKGDNEQVDDILIIGWKVV